jgi:hypothetical protein
VFFSPPIGRGLRGGLGTNGNAGFCRWRQQAHQLQQMNVDATYRIKLFIQIASPLPNPLPMGEGKTSISI